MLLPSPTLPRLACLVLGIALLFTGCRSRFDPVGTDYATNFGSELVAAMNRGVEPYADHEKTVAQVRARLEKAYIHAAEQRYNQEIAQSWKLLRDEQVAPFFEQWKTKGRLSGEYVRETVRQVQKSLEAIRIAEAGKARKKE